MNLYDTFYYRFVVESLVFQRYTVRDISKIQRTKKVKSEDYNYMSLFFGYIIDGIFYLKNSCLLGGTIYLLIVLILHFLKIRRQMTWQCVPELLLSIYGIALLKITGIFSLSFSLSGFKNINLVPFVGGSAMMTFLNFLLFLPLGFLLPVVFRSCKQNMKVNCKFKFQFAKVKVDFKKSSQK